MNELVLSFVYSMNKEEKKIFVTLRDQTNNGPIQKCKRAKANTNTPQTDSFVGYFVWWWLSVGKTQRPRHTLLDDNKEGNDNKNKRIQRAWEWSCRLSKRMSKVKKKIESRKQFNEN